MNYSRSISATIDNLEGCRVLFELVRNKQGGPTKGGGVQRTQSRRSSELLARVKHDRIVEDLQNWPLARDGRRGSAPRRLRERTLRHQLEIREALFHLLCDGLGRAAEER